MASKSPEKLPGFEEALEELESIIERIESGDVTLEKSIEECLRGRKLITHCEQVLARVRERLGELKIDTEGRATPIGEEAANATGGMPDGQGSGKTDGDSIPF